MSRDEPGIAMNTDAHLSSEPDADFSLRGELRPSISFPPLPHTVESVSELLSEMGVEPNTMQLAQIVDSDPMVAASVLRRINSAYYGVRRRIASVQKAVMLLGFLEVANLVLTAGMVQLEETFGADEPSKLFNRIMRRCIGTAQYARELAGHLHSSSEGPAFSAGLLHAVGRLIMLHNDAETYERLWDQAGAPPARDAENEAFGIDHARLGAVAADEWKLPGLLIKAIRYYPTPEKLEEQEQRLVARVVGTAAAAIDRMRLADGVEAEREYEATPELAALAEEMEADPEQLVAFIEKKRPRVRSYVDTMMQH
jgi:HD-like signal output (HDOD) protein